MEKQLPQQGNIPLSANPVQGAWTGQIKPVRLNPNLNGYKGGKLADLPMYNKSTDVNPVQPTSAKRTVVQIFTRGSYQS
jgi:hypothetical protein